MYPANYRVYGLAIGYAGTPLTPYSMVTDAPHTLPILRSKTTNEFVAIDLTEQSRSGKAHVFVAKDVAVLLDLIRTRYGVYKPGGFWTSFTPGDFKNMGTNMYSVYSAAVHKVMQRLSESQYRVTSGALF
jgi:hypothetical protein